jgi:hypothetical protein
MSDQPYRFFINPFDVVTRKSNRLMKSIGEDHFAKLTGQQADPEIAAILLTYTPVWQSFRTTQQNLSSVLGTYKGKTKTLKELFDELIHERLPEWEGKIHGVYYKGTPAEIAFFPQRLKPFEGGTYEDRIDAIKVLGDKCALDANAVVGAASVGILAFHTAIESARVAQQSQGEGAAATLRTLLETARLLLAQELYGNLGLLMHKYRDKPTDVEQYFEMSYLRSAGSGLEEVDIHPDEVANINDSIEPGDVVGKKAKNTSLEDVTMGIYFANSLSEPPQPGYAVVELRQGAQITLDETLLGPPKQFLNVINLSKEHRGSMEISDDLVQGGRPVAN